MTETEREENTPWDPEAYQQIVLGPGTGNPPAPMPVFVDWLEDHFLYLFLVLMALFPAIVGLGNLLQSGGGGALVPIN